MDTSIESAKRLYFINFGNHMTMLKNGEYKEYMKYNISPETEYEWSLEIKDQLIEEIISGKDLLKVRTLSRINLPENDIISAFELLANSPLKVEIFNTIKLLGSLFEPSMYEKITKVFS